MSRSRALLLLLSLTLVAGGVYAAVRFFAPASDDAVELVPANAVLYVNLFIEPSTEQKLALEDLVAHFERIGTPEEAGEQIAELFDRLLAGSGLSFEDDVEPWLGPQVALFLTSFDAVPDGAMLIAADDEAAAETALRRAVSAQGEPTRRDYRGTSYLFDGYTASGLVDGFAVIGSEPGLKAVIDVAARRLRPLSATAAFDRATRGLEPDRLALVYLDLVRAVPSAAKRAQVELLLGEQSSFALTMHARSDGLVFESSSAVAPGGASVLWAPTGSGLLGELPASAWLGAGGEDLGERAEALLELGTASATGVDLDTVLAQLRRTFGFDLRAHLTDWMGDFGLFFAGGRSDEVRGALVVESRDRAASTAGLLELERLLLSLGLPVERQPPGGGPGFALELPGLEEPLVVLDGGARVALALGRAAADRVLGPGETLERSALFARARRALGDGFELNLFVDVQAVRGLIEAAGALDDPTYATEVRSWLEPLGYLAAGTRRQGDALVSRMMIGVR
jgi:hypothetical protein